MNGRIASDDDLVIHYDMATQNDAGCQLAVVMNLGVMTNMCIGHEVVVVADASRLVGLASVASETFAEGVLIPDHDPGIHCVMIKPEILGWAADVSTGVEDIAVPDHGASANPVLPHQPCTGLDHHRPGDNAMGADDDVIIKMNVAFDDRGWVNGRGLGHWSWASSYHGESGNDRSGENVDPVMQIEHRGATIEITDLGHMPYEAALVEQRRRQKMVIESRDTASPRMDLLLVEHDPPVITISNRPGASEHLLADDEQLAARGVEVHATDRGGDITWHGPGQIVVYPILDLNRLGLRLHDYLRWLEDIVLRTLARWDVIGHRDSEATGVWVGADDASARKICAMGVRVSRWVTMHGLALNVNPDLSHFDLIVPCGLTGRSVTSLANELGPTAPTLQDVAAALRDEFIEAVIRSA